MMSDEISPDLDWRGANTKTKIPVNGIPPGSNVSNSKRVLLELPTGEKIFGK